MDNIITEIIKIKLIILLNSIIAKIIKIKLIILFAKIIKKKISKDIFRGSVITNYNINKKVASNSFGRTIRAYGA